MLYTVKKLRLNAVYLTVFVSIMFITIVLFMFTILTSDKCFCNDEQSKRTLHKNDHRLAILVPFRDRFDELLIFAPYMDKFLKNQNVDYDIFILNQVDNYRFNRASLINVGYTFTKRNYDYIAMHDVDLLPLNTKLLYKYPKEQPFHIAAPHLHPKYHYKTFVGGILLVNREHFAQVNGMSNKYWGWGLEDDEFYVRLMSVGLNVSRPIDIGTNTTNTFRHIHDRNRRKRDMTKCYNQREVTRRRDHETGLNNVRYKIVSINNITIDNTPVTILNIQLICDKILTPWCVCDEENKKLTKDTKLTPKK